MEQLYTYDQTRIANNGLTSADFFIHKYTSVQQIYHVTIDTVCNTVALNGITVSSMEAEVSQEFPVQQYLEEPTEATAGYLNNADYKCGSFEGRMSYVSGPTNLLSQGYLTFSGTVITLDVTNSELTNDIAGTYRFQINFVQINSGFSNVGERNLLSYTFTLTINAKKIIIIPDTAPYFDGYQTSTSLPTFFATEGDTGITNGLPSIKDDNDDPSKAVISVTFPDTIDSYASFDSATLMITISEVTTEMVGTSTITLVVTDAAGNSNTFTKIFSVAEKKVIEVPE